MKKLDTTLKTLWIAFFTVVVFVVGSWLYTIIKLVTS